MPSFFEILLSEYVERGELKLQDTSYGVSCTLCRLAKIFNNTSFLKEVIEESKDYSIDLCNINKCGLLHLWSYDGISSMTKVILTCLWGGIREENLGRMVNDSQFNIKSRILVDNLEKIKTVKTLEDFDTQLKFLFDALESDIKTKISGFGVSFFTKVFFFYFWANPLVNQFENATIPIICDTWMKRAIYLEESLIKNGIDYLDNNKKGKICLRPVNNSHGDSYISFCRRFTQRCNSLKEKNIGLTPYILESYLFLRENRDRIKKQLKEGGYW